ncbi:hypothetical protein D3C75_1104320 [compost metagenome]
MKDAAAEQFAEQQLLYCGGDDCKDQLAEDKGQDTDNGHPKEHADFAEESFLFLLHRSTLILRIGLSGKIQMAGAFCAGIQ